MTAERTWFRYREMKPKDRAFYDKAASRFNWNAFAKTQVSTSDGPSPSTGYDRFRADPGGVLKSAEREEFNQITNEYDRRIADLEGRLKLYQDFFSFGRRLRDKFYTPFGRFKQFSRRVSRALDTF